MKILYLRQMHLLMVLLAGSQHGMATVSAGKAFAELNHEKLIGKWRCSSEIAEYQIKTNAQDEYRADGAYSSESVTEIKRGDTVQRSSIQVEAQWTLSGNSVRLSQIQLKAVRSDDPAYAVRLQEVFQKFDWAENRILSISRSSLVFLPLAPMASDRPIHCQR